MPDYLPPEDRLSRIAQAAARLGFRGGSIPPQHSAEHPSRPPQPCPPGEHYHQVPPGCRYVGLAVHDARHGDLVTVLPVYRPPHRSDLGLIGAVRQHQADDETRAAYAALADVARALGMWEATLHARSITEVATLLVAEVARRDTLAASDGNHMPAGSSDPLAHLRAEDGHIPDQHHTEACRILAAAGGSHTRGDAQERYGYLEWVDAPDEPYVVSHDVHGGDHTIARAASGRVVLGIALHDAQQGEVVTMRLSPPSPPRWTSLADVAAAGETTWGARKLPKPARPAGKLPALERLERLVTAWRATADAEQQEIGALKPSDPNAPISRGKSMARYECADRLANTLGITRQPPGTPGPAYPTVSDDAASPGDAPEE